MTIVNPAAPPRSDFFARLVSISTVLRWPDICSVAGIPRTELADSCSRTRVGTRAGRPDRAHNAYLVASEVGGRSRSTFKPPIDKTRQAVESHRTARPWECRRWHSGTPAAPVRAVMLMGWPVAATVRSRTGSQAGAASARARGRKKDGRSPVESTDSDHSPGPCFPEW